MHMGEEVFQHSEALVSRDLAGEKVLIPVRGKVGDLGSIYTLNGTAGEIWNLLDGQRRAAEIVAAMAQEYDIDGDTLAADVERTLAEMREEGLIVMTSAGGQG